MWHCMTLWQIMWQNDEYNFWLYEHEHPKYTFISVSNRRRNQYKSIFNMVLISLISDTLTIHHIWPIRTSLTPYGYWDIWIFGNKNLEMQIFPNLFHMGSNMGPYLGLSNSEIESHGLHCNFWSSHFSVFEQKFRLFDPKCWLFNRNFRFLNKNFRVMVRLNQKWPRKSVDFHHEKFHNSNISRIVKPICTS